MSGGFNPVNMVSQTALAAATGGSVEKGAAVGGAGGAVVGTVVD